MGIKIGNKTFTDEEVQKMLDAGMLGAAQKNDTTTTLPTMPSPHGFWGDGTTPGVLSEPGVDYNIFNATVLPPPSMIARFYMGVTDRREPRYDILTGVDAASGDNAEGFCDTAPTAGYMRLCMNSTEFGKYYMQTENIVAPEIGGRIDNADVDKRLIGGELNTQYPFFPQIPGFSGTPDTKFNRVLGNALYRFGVHTNRVWERVFYEGNFGLAPANTETGFIQEFNGLDQLITTGHTDLVTGLACTAADSIVENYNNVNINDTSSQDIVDYLVGIYYELKTLSGQNGFEDAWDGEIHMEPDLFYALTRIWPKSYLTEGATVIGISDAAPIMQSAQDNIDMRDAMRMGKFLLMDGNRVPVVTTRAIARTASGLGFSSDVYFVHRRAMGMPTTYVEGFDMANADAVEFLQNPMMNGRILTTNGGLYMSTVNQTKFCLEYLFAAKPRLVLRTPYLCARITSVNYNLRNYSRDAYPDEPYYQNGGRYVGTPRYTA